MHLNVSPGHLLCSVAVQWLTGSFPDLTLVRSKKLTSWDWRKLWGPASVFLQLWSKSQKAKLEHSLHLILTRSHSTSYHKLQTSDGRMKESKTKKEHSYHCAPAFFSICMILSLNLIFLPKSSFYPKILHGSVSLLQRKWILLYSWSVIKERSVENFCENFLGHW